MICIIRNGGSDVAGKKELSAPRCNNRTARDETRLKSSRLCMLYHYSLVVIISCNVYRRFSTVRFIGQRFKFAPHTKICKCSFENANYCLLKAFPLTRQLIDVKHVSICINIYTYITTVHTIFYIRLFASLIVIHTCHLYSFRLRTLKCVDLIFFLCPLMSPTLTSVL